MPHRHCVPTLRANGSVMQPAGSLTVRVTGKGTALLPTTWSQRSNTSWHGPIDEDNYHAAGASHELPMGCDLAAVGRAIQHVLGRHDALRSVFRTEGSGLRQVIHASGEVTVPVFETVGQDLEQDVDDAIDFLCADPWNGRQWPIRFAVLTSGHPLLLVVTYNRLILDAYSAATVTQEVLKACTGDTSELPPRWQVTEEARYQVSADGAAASDRSLAHWRNVLASSPSSLFDYPRPHPSGPDRYTMASIESSALGRAVLMMRRRWRVTGATLLLSAAALVLGRYTGHRTVVMQLITANRGDRNRRHMVGSLTSQGLLRLDVGSGRFADLAHQAFRASSEAHRSGYYDPDAAQALRAEIGLQRGACLDLGALFNDRSTGQEASDAEPEVSERELRELAARDGLLDGSAAARPPEWTGSFQVYPESPTLKDARFLMMCNYAPCLPISLFCDMTYIPLAAAKRMLGGMERVLIAAACGDLDVTELSQISAVEPVRRDDAWVRSGDGWTDMAATASLWRQVTGGRAATVTVEDQRLVGYLAGQGAPSPAALHAAFVTALGDRNDVHAPDWYRLVDSPPADLADAAAWRRAAVTAEGTGRP